MTKRDEYTSKIKHQLDALNAEIDHLETRTKEAKEDAHDAYKAEMAKLRHQSKLAAEKYDELKAAGEATWDKMVAEMDKISSAFTHSFSYFKSQVK